MTYDNDLPHLSCLATGQILKLSQRMDLYVQPRRRSWGGGVPGELPLIG